MGGSARAEEPDGTTGERAVRLLGRGREETIPLALHLGVLVAVGLLVGAILLVAVVLWHVLR